MKDIEQPKTKKTNKGYRSRASDILSIDLKGNAMDSLHRAGKFLYETKNPYKWKWFIIAIHHATYCFMLVALLRTDLSGIWENVPKRRNGLIDLHNRKNRLISFETAFEWIQDSQRMSGYIDSKPFKAQTHHEEAVKYLNDRRNEFVHLKPVTLIRSAQDFAKIEPILEIIEFLVFESRRCNFEDKQQRKIKDDLEKIRNFFKNFKNAK